MKSLWLTAVVSVVLVSCHDGTDPSSDRRYDSSETAGRMAPPPVDQAGELPEVPDQPLNALTQAEREAGWKLLFDGQSLNGWKMFRNKANNSWSVQEGMLHCKGSPTDKSDLRTDIVTEDDFRNFELLIEWKISPAGNSGLMYLVSEEASAAYLTGPEYQMIDDLGFPERLEDWQKSGANYAMHSPLEIRSRPVGEWNQTRLIVNKGKVEHWLNGEKVVEYELGSEDWEKRKQEGKWKDEKRYGSKKEGKIALQDHGDETWFRNILIRDLKD